MYANIIRIYLPHFHIWHNIIFLLRLNETPGISHNNCRKVVKEIIPIDFPKKGYVSLVDNRNSLDSDLKVLVKDQENDQKFL